MIENKITRRSLSANPGRNIFLIIAIFMTTYSLATIMSLAIGYMETRKAFYIRRDGSYFDETLGINYIFAVVGVFLVIVGFLFIYNVMSVSVSRDVRFYGLLKTLGMTPKQIRATVFRQILILSFIGILLGLIASALTSLVFVPEYSRMAMQGLTEEDIVISFSPGIYIGAALFAFITVMIGAFNPAKKAAGISAIEAVRFTEYGYKRAEIRSSPFNPLKIAWRNVFRVNKRAVLVFASLAIGMSMFLIVTVITGSMNAVIETGVGGMDRFGGSDVRLTNSSPNQAFTAEIMKKLNTLPGLTEINIKYSQKIEIEVVDFAGDYGYNFVRKIDAYGLSKRDIIKLNENVYEPFDEEAFERGEFVVMRDTGNPALLESEYINFYFEDKNEPLLFKIGGIELPYINEGWVNPMPVIYISGNLLRELVDEPFIYEIELFIEKDKQKQAVEIIKECTGDIESVWRTSAVEMVEDAESGTMLMVILGGSIALIFCFIGVLNFVNIISTSILSRRHELALFESIGQSKKQSIKMLTFEGMIYAVTSLLLTCIFGGALSYWLFTLAFGIEELTGFNVFRFPYQFMIMVAIIFIICLIVPQIVYFSVSKKATIMERLREIE